MKLTVLVEGRLEEPIVRRLLREARHSASRVFVCDGKSDFMARWPDFSTGPGPRLGLRDLDDEAVCAPQWLRSRDLGLGGQVLLRLAVREVESWLLADRERFASHFRCPVQMVTRTPDELELPKDHVVELMRRSADAAVRQQMVPRKGGGRIVGEGHTTLLGEFATRTWRPRHAARRSDSLRAALAALDNLRAGR